MSFAWPSDRMSWSGLLEFALVVVGIPAGVVLLRHAGARYVEPSSTVGPLFVAGSVALVVAGVGSYRLVRRGEYPWLIAAAAVALPFFEPSAAPYTPAFRVVVAFRDLLLIAAVVSFVVRALGAADEFERRIHFQALAFSYAAAVIVLAISAEAADVLPLRGTWIASAMLATWFVSWFALAIRYQR